MKDYMKDVHIEDALKAGHTDTICWDCKNAMRGGGAAGQILTVSNRLTDGPR